VSHVVVFKVVVTCHKPTYSAGSGGVLADDAAGRFEFEHAMSSNKTVRLKTASCDV